MIWLSEMDVFHDHCHNLSHAFVNRKVIRGRAGIGKMRVLIYIIVFVEKASGSRLVFDYLCDPSAIESSEDLKYLGGGRIAL